MTIKRLFKRAEEVPDKLRRKAFRLLRKSKSGLFSTQLVRSVKRYARMEATRALGIFLKFTHFQLSIRPRIRLVAAVTLILLFSLIGAGRGVDFLRDKKPDIKVNGQAILVAQKSEEPTPAPQIEGAVSYKKSPMEFVRPARGYISQGFSAYHRAIDITDEYGSPIKPLGTGHIEFTGFMADGHGNTVVVDHGDGLKSLYAHLQGFNVKSGEEVSSSTTIGYVGLTGHTTGPHVHVEVNDNGIAVDPAKLLPE